MVCRSFSISTCWPNVINIQGWFLPDHGYFITDDKPCSGKSGGGRRAWGRDGPGGMVTGWAQPLQRAETDCHAFASTSQTLLSRSLSAFCFSCQENWQAVGTKKKKAKVKVLPTWQNKRGAKKNKAEADGLFLERPLQLWMVYAATKSCQFWLHGQHTWPYKESWKMIRAEISFCGEKLNSPASVALFSSRVSVRVDGAFQGFCAVFFTWMLNDAVNHYRAAHLSFVALASHAERAMQSVWYLSERRVFILQGILSVIRSERKTI